MLLLRQSLVTGLLLMLLLLPVELLFNGLGLSKVSHYFDHYQGSMSWATYRVTFQPLGTGRQPAPAPWFPTFRYGFNLTHQAALRARVLHTEVSLAEVGPLLYDTVSLPAGFSPDSVYLATVGLRGNYLSYAFGMRPGAEVLGYQAVAAPATAGHLQPQPHWSRPLWLYAWAALTLPMWFFAAGMAVSMLPSFRRPADRLLALLLVLTFAAVRGYVDWLDHTTGGTTPVLGPLLAVFLLGAYVYQLFQPAPVEEVSTEQ